MVLYCNICDKTIGNESYYIFDKMHCSIKCKNIYKKIMEEKKLGPNELYYEREYFSINKKNNSFSSICNNSYDLKNRFISNKKSISCPIIERPSTPVLPAQKMDENQELRQIVIHNEKNMIIEDLKKRGYFQLLKDFSLECIKFLKY